jgi:hypothetical protein
MVRATAITPWQIDSSLRVRSTSRRRTRNSRHGRPETARTMGGRGVPDVSVGGLSTEDARWPAASYCRHGGCFGPGGIWCAFGPGLVAQNAEGHAGVAPDEIEPGEFAYRPDRQRTGSSAAVPCHRRAMRRRGSGSRSSSRARALIHLVIGLTIAGPRKEEIERRGRHGRRCVPLRAELDNAAIG